jgi:hypothetical protein
MEVYIEQMCLVLVIAVRAVAYFNPVRGSLLLCCFSAHRSGNVGVIHYIESETDLDWLLDSATADPYIPLIKPLMFTRYVSSI